MDSENWLPVVGYESYYEVSDLGRARSLRRRIPLKPSYSNTGGYGLLILTGADGTRKGKYLHQLVMEAFVGPRPDGQQVRHKVENDPRNNKLTNLEYGTPSDDRYDQVRHGSHPEASRNTCDNGHEYTEANTYLDPKRGGSRVCRACRNGRAKTWRERNAKSDRRCSEGDCEKPPVAKGLCRTHYTQQWRSNRT